MSKLSTVHCWSAQGGRHECAWQLCCKAEGHMMSCKCCFPAPHARMQQLVNRLSMPPHQPPFNDCIVLRDPS